MDRKLMFAWVLFLCINAMSPCHGYYSQSMPYVPPKEKITKLHFYFHDTVSGKNPTAVPVARPSFATVFNDTPIPFGSVYATDDYLTIGPDLNSGVIGNARGLWSSTGRDVLTIVVYWDLGFTSGEFNGSSISVFSRNPITENERELAVVGGRGKFKMAKGFVKLKTYLFDTNTFDAIVECDVTVIHH